jgi:hypothetical protein
MADALEIDLPAGAPPARQVASDLRDAARLLAGVCPGMFLLGISFGLLVDHAGLAWWWTPIFSGLCFAGSLEFVLIALATTATPLATIALTSVLVNGRHLFYGLSFPLHGVHGRSARAYSMFALTDEAYALTTSGAADKLGSRGILAMQALMHASWVGGGVAGALAGSASQRTRRTRHRQRGRTRHHNLSQQPSPQRLRRGQFGGLPLQRLAQADRRATTTRSWSRAPRTFRRPLSPTAAEMPSIGPVPERPGNWPRSR